MKYFLEPRAEASVKWLTRIGCKNRALLRQISVQTMQRRDGKLFYMTLLEEAGILAKLDRFEAWESYVVSGVKNMTSRTSRVEPVKPKS